MASITASTTIKVKKAAPAPTKATKGKAAADGKRGKAPPLKPATLNKADTIERLVALKEKDPPACKNAVRDIFDRVLGQVSVAHNLSTPHAASTTRDRAGAAADLAVAAEHLSLRYVLKECQILSDIQRTLFPQGIEVLLASATDSTTEGGDKTNAKNDADGSVGPTLKPSASALSLSSLEADNNADTFTATTANSLARGKTSAPDAREGCLLLLRALCEHFGQLNQQRRVEPYVIGAFLAAALDECGSSSSNVREAAEDTAGAMISLAHPWSFPSLVAPLLLDSLHRNSTEWRIKAMALDLLEQCAKTAALTDQVRRFIPTLIPAITSQVWDTKAKVSKSARAALLAICDTNINQDVKPAIPAVVNAICKPSDTNKAVQALMGSTFVVPVDAPTLAILVPILARALKEKLAIHKRSACLVISNMSKLVESPQAVAPFGSLLVPELQKVATNVQFEEIRDEALKALANLTKALGDLYQQGETMQDARVMKEEELRVRAEQERIEAEKKKQQQADEETKKKEEEERQRFKEAMDAQRELDKLAAVKAAEDKKAEEQSREQQKLSTKRVDGKCQSCGLKKCKKSCMFYSGK